MQEKEYNKKNLFLKAQYLLEFNKILELASEYTVSDEARSRLLELQHSELNVNPIDELILIEELSTVLRSVNFNLSTYHSIEKDVQLLEIQNAELSKDTFIKIRKLAINVLQILQLLKKDELKSCALLINFISLFPDLNFVLKSINEIFDDVNEIRDQASPELQILRDKIKKFQKVLYSTFKKQLELARVQGILAEGEESIRNGRFVFRVLAEHKRKTPGIIVDESDSGKTVFIEPQVCVELNIDLIELELEEKREISKILKLLTIKIKPFNNDFIEAYNLLVSFDVLLAKSRFGISIHAIRPHISSDQNLIINNGFHPLLYINLLKKGETPQALNFFLNNKNRILLISGPNAGGKTVVLKTVGLLQLMLQKGFLIPVSKGSVFPIFNNIWVDIGDLQSIEDGLSTYSAKMTYMKCLLQNFDEKSLILIDEIGSGTEPKIGGAIAESILVELIKKNAMGVLTTHYANLKAFAHSTAGLVNGAMLYDESKMQPKYILQVGKPGSSYALDIALKLDFPKHLIDYAKKRAGKDLVKMEDLISKLEEEKMQLVELNTSYLKKLESLNKIIKAYEGIQKQYELKRLKLKMDTKQLEHEQSILNRNQHTELVNEIKTKLDLVKAKQLAEENRIKVNAISEELLSISTEYTKLIRKDFGNHILKIGDKVSLLKHNMIGVISELSDKTAKVITEHFTFNLDKSELVLVQESLIKPVQNSIKVQLIDKASNFVSTLDLRGQSAMDALRMLDEYMDQALIANIKEIKILHGKGSGALRKSIHQVLKKNKFIENYSHPEEINGGQGLTIIQFK
ncbi:MAG: Smr/MutS family protein [Saprospiraceae bacterium]|nr:Smr/MutS family protein [Saprospiraceae bacterium]